MNYNELNFSIGATHIPVKFIEVEQGSKDAVLIGRKFYTYQVPGEFSEKITTILKETLAQSPADFNDLQNRINARVVQSRDNKLSYIAQPILTAGIEKPNSIIRGEKAKKMDIFLQSIEKSLFFRGSVLIQENGETILKKGYGLSRENAQNSPQTAFQIASTTKQFTAVAILKLIEQGKIGGVNDLILNYLPENLKSEKWEGITIHQLLTHTSRIPDNFALPKFKIAKKEAEENGGIFTPTKDELIGYMQEADLIPHDSSASYSNCGYYLLGAIIEHVINQSDENPKRSYGDYINEIIPSEMRSTGYYNDKQQKFVDMAHGSELNEAQNGLSPLKHVAAQEAYSAGGLYSTVEDLAVWNNALHAGKIINEENLQLLLTDHAQDARGQHFGYGTFIDPDSQSDITSGTFPHATKSLIIHPKRSDNLVVLLTNNHDVPERCIAQSLTEILEGKEVTESILPAEAVINFPENELFGNGNRDAEHRFVRSNDRFYVQYVNGHKDLLAPLSNGVFVNVKWGTRFQFDGDEVRVTRQGEKTATVLKKLVNS